MGTDSNGSCHIEPCMQALGNVKQKNQMKTEKRRLERVRADFVLIAVFATELYVVWTSQMGLIWMNGKDCSHPSV